MKYRLLSLISLLAFVWCLYHLLTASSLLNQALIEQPYFPAGTLITWLGFIALPSAIYFGHSSLVDPRRKLARVFSVVFRILIIAGLFYGFICFYLAGNWGFSFDGGGGFRGSQMAASIFWQFNYILASFSLLAFFLYHALKFLLRNIE